MPGRIRSGSAGSERIAGGSVGHDSTYAALDDEPGATDEVVACCAVAEIERAEFGAGDVAELGSGNLGGGRGSARCEPALSGRPAVGGRLAWRPRP